MLAKDEGALRKSLAEELDVEDALLYTAALAFEPLPGVPFSAIVGENVTLLRRSMNTYLFIFAALSATHAELTNEASADTSDALAVSVLRALSAAQSGKEIDNILLDDIAMLLVKVGEAQALERVEAFGEDDEGPFAGLMKSLGGSKIADMASEISKEIDLSGVAGQNPKDLLSFDKLGDSSSMLGNIVSKVGSKIQAKLANGELKQDELLGEAVGFLKAFEGTAGKGGGGGLAAALAAFSGGNGKLDIGSLMGALGGGGEGGGGIDMGSLVGEVMKAAQGMKAVASPSPTHERLRRKLEKKKAEPNR
jgi:hypothetical protein